MNLFRKIVSALATIIIISCATSAIFTVREVSIGLQSGPVRNLNTGLDYLTIQAAIDAPETLDGHTILVDPGSYSENLLISKSINLTGTDRSNTIIDEYVMLNVGAHNVTISRFTIKGIVSCDTWNNFTLKDSRVEAPAWVHLSNNSVIINNEIYVVPWGDWGVRLEFNWFCTFENNTIWGPHTSGVGSIVAYIAYNCTFKGNHIFGDPLSINTCGFLIAGNNNLIFGNTVEDCTYGIFIVGGYYDVSRENRVFHNNLVDCQTPLYAWDLEGTGEHLVDNTWDSGYPYGGNYYNNYAGVDNHIGPSQDKPGKDALGDTPYIIDPSNQDNYPLMFPWSWERKTSPVTYDSRTDYVGTVSNGLLSGFSFDWNLKQLAFVGKTDKPSFCIVAVPKTLLDGGLQLLVNDTIQPCILMWNSTHISMYFEYGSDLISVKILGERVTPILGDINGDHIVDIFDAILLANHYNEHYP